jgi:hypothetical protein
MSNWWNIYVGLSFRANPSYHPAIEDPHLFQALQLQRQGAIEHKDHLSFARSYKVTPTNEGLG